MSGDVRRWRGGIARVLMLLTGAALLAWLARGLGALVGWRQRGSLRLRREVLEVRAERHLMGLCIGHMSEVLPLAHVRRVRLRGESALWPVLSAIGALTLAGASGTVLMAWGYRGGQVSWLVLGLSLIAAGVVLDALAYLWTRRILARGRGEVLIWGKGLRLRVSGVPLDQARALVDALSQGRPGSERPSPVAPGACGLAPNA